MIIMRKQIVAINFPKETIERFRNYFLLDQLELFSCRNLSDATTLLLRGSFCLIMLDALALTVDETQEAVQRLRNITYIPLLVLTSPDAAASTLEVGADVWMPQGVEIHAMFSQAMALIRRYTVFNHFNTFYPDAAVLYRGNLMIDSIRHRVTVSGQEITLLPREFRLLAYFARNPGLVLTQEQLGHAIWLSEHDYNRDVKKVVSDLRRKLSDISQPPKYIETVHSVGYRFLPKD